MTRATVVVCTLNRSRALEGSLEGVAGLSAPFAWELVVVDNGSTDDTLAVARAFASSRPELVRVASEPVVGLSAARNCGVRLARGEWLAFLDDDAEPVPGWLEAYDRALAEPGVLSAGGPVEPVYSGPLPSWCDERFLPYLTVWERGDDPVDLRYNELPRGTNVAYRREAFELVGGFDRRLGRRASSLRSCEETELGLRLERSGARSRYVPAARVRHRVDTGRLTPEWMVRRVAAQAFSEAIVDWKHYELNGIRAGYRHRLGELDKVVRAGADADALPHRTERAARSAYCAGALYALAMVEVWRPERGRLREI